MLEPPPPADSEGPIDDCPEGGANLLQEQSGADAWRDLSRLRPACFVVCPERWDLYCSCPSESERAHVRVAQSAPPTSLPPRALGELTRPLLPSPGQRC